MNSMGESSSRDDDVSATKQVCKAYPGGLIGQPVYCNPELCNCRETAEILDACCGGRMWWWDKAHPLAVYVDKRERPAGTILQKPLWKIAPDVVADFCALPLEDESFRLVVFDPPHQVSSRAGTGINAEQYGSWDDSGERDEALRLGFAECWRVLTPGGTLVFKWAGKVAEIEPAFPAVPVVGTRPRGRHSGPSWVIFYKPIGASGVTA